MEIIEIIFILLLILPVALLMRYFVSRLSVETPKQRKNTNENKPSIRAWRQERRQRQEAAATEEEEPQPPREKRTEEPRSSRRSGRGRRKQKLQEVPKQEIPARPANSDFVPRAHKEIRRSDRVPFSEIYGSASSGAPTKQSIRTAARHTQTMHLDPIPLEPSRSEASRKRPRSEQAPSKRQKRKNRQRARQRELNRRNKTD